MIRSLPFLIVLMLSASDRTAADNEQSPRDEFHIFDGQPTRLYFTGNPHHPTFGREKLANLLDRYFDGKSPILVDGLADACKERMTWHHNGGNSSSWEFLQRSQFQDVGLIPLLLVELSRSSVGEAITDDL